ncbi:MAG: SPOR domain-containing protein [Pseudomonadales bacterium]|nr:SPOR domain-containing protein [Pseudomonadales bacterium]
MDDGLKQRVVGAVVLVSAAVIILPNLLNRPVDEPILNAVQIPDRPAMLTIKSPTKMGDVRKHEVMSQINADRLALAQFTDTESINGGDASNATPPMRHLQGAWTIQLASFRQNTNAQDLVGKLQAQGYNAYLETLTSKTGNDAGLITRVYVGPELKKDRAVKVMAQLEKELNLKDIMLIRFVP